MNNLHKKSAIAVVLFLLTFCYKATAQTGINRISKEQKMYELSVVWKELSYNFANMDNCPKVHLDSLYREYMIVVQNTKNDWEYYKAMYRFLSNFNNGHVTIYNRPDYYLDYLGYLLLTTTCKDNKIIVENIGIHNAKKINIGDEIVMVNNLPVMDFLQKQAMPYVAVSNEEVKFRYAMFGMNKVLNTALKDEKITLGIKMPKGIKQVTLSYDCYYKPLPKEMASQRNKQYLDTNAYANFLSVCNNLFLEDTVHNFAYIRLTRCDTSFQSFFLEHYEKIMQRKHLIVDVHYNEGGSSNATWAAIAYLLNNDSIYVYTDKTRVNNAVYKAWATIKKLFYEDDEVPEFYKINYYPYYDNTAFEKVEGGSYGEVYPCPVPDEWRYKGKTHVLISEDNGSAGEYFAAMLSQNKDITFWGKKTVGAFGQPLIVRLPSGIDVMINTTKTYDFQGRDISSGFPPDYEYDFSDVYKINDPQEMLGKLIEVIKEIEKTEK